MMNAGIIPPDDGYLAGLKDLLHADGALPHLRRGEDRLHHRPRRARPAGTASPPTSSAWPRRWAAASPVAAIGGIEEVMSADRRRPLRAGRHVQRQPAGDGRGPGQPEPRCSTTAAYAHLDALRGRGPAAASRTHRRARPAVAGGQRRRQGLRLVHRRARSATTATSSRSTTAGATLHWLVQHNGGVFLPPWGKVEQWLLSVQHTDDDVDRLVANFGDAGRRLPGTATRGRLMAGGALRLVVADQVVRRRGRRRRHRPRDPRRRVLLAARRLRAAARPRRCG